MKKPATKTTRKLNCAIIIAGLALAVATPLRAAATDYTWTNTATDTSDYWTNGVFWAPAFSGYPGNAADTPNAWLTNNVSVAGGAYTNILNFGLAQTINSLVISNGNSGQAWLIITNAAGGTTILTNTTFKLGSGGRLQIESSGVLTGITGFTWSGTNSAINLNTGSKLFTAAGVTIGSAGGSYNTANVLSNATWNLGAYVLNLGTAMSTGNVLNITGGTVANSTANPELQIFGVSNRVVISQSGKLTQGTVSDGSEAHVGDAGSYDQVLVTDTGSVWTVSVIRPGYNGGRFNSLIVSNGGDLRLAQFNVYGKNNSVVVTGPGSVMESPGATWYFWIGDSSPSNSLTIANGGKVNFGSGGFEHRIGSGAGSDANQALVTDTGSFWSNNCSAFYVGDGSSFNSLVISNGGSVYVQDNTGGNFFGSGATTGNVVTVTGGGSAYKTPGTISVGYSGSFSNRLTIANGGTVSATLVKIGNGAGANSNVVTVTGTGSSLSAVTAASISIVGTNSFGNQLNISDGGGFNTGSGAGGGKLVVGYGPGGGNNSYNVGSVGGFSTATNWMLVVGQGGSGGNSVTITNALLYTRDTASPSQGAPVIGWGTSNNTVSVLAGGTWNVGSNGFLVGDDNNQAMITTGNRLIVDGGVVTNIEMHDDGFEIAASAGSSSNGMIISHGGKVFVTAGTVQYGSILGIADKYAYAVVRDTGSVWWTAGPVEFGLGNNNGGYQSLTVSNGGQVYDTTMRADNSFGGTYYSGPENYTIVVTGGGSMITNSTGFLLGGNSGSNSLTISKGGLLVTGTGAITNGSGSGGYNTVLVTDPGSAIRAGTTITVGGGAGGNSLTISNGASALASSITVGGGNNNSVRVKNGGVLEANSLVIGSGSGNTISNVGGVYQFSTASPTITPNGAGNIVITDATVSFRGIDSADVTNNLGNGALSGIQFAGANTFMLNAGSNNVSGQAYTFQTVASPANYAHLAMINGATAYRGGGVTIGATGSLLVSNTAASFTEVVTNSGMMALVNSTATFANGLVNQGTVTNYSNNTLTGLLTMNNAVFVTAGGAAQTLAGNVNLPATGTFDTAGGALTLAGTISNSGGLTKIGAGNLVLPVANTFGGETRPMAGTVVLADGFAVSNSTVNLAVGDTGLLVFSNTATAYTLGGLKGGRDLGLANTAGLGIALTVGNNSLSSTYAGVLSGSGSLTKVGDGMLELTGHSTFSGAVAVNAGQLLVNGALAGGGPLTLSANATLGGSGTVGRVVGGAGVVSPGNSPGILAVNQVNPSGGLGFDFEFTQLGSPTYTTPLTPGNDVLRITNATPFTAVLTLANTNNLYVTAPLAAGIVNVLRGGFYSDSGAMFDSTINGATYNLWVDNVLVGEPAFVHTVVETTPWGTGRILEIGVWGRMIPEPQVLMFWLAGAVTMYAARRRIRTRQS